MSIDKHQLREFIATVLKEVGLHTPEAEELLMLTAATESNLGTYIKQKGGGPALGVFQIEPRTYYDIIDNYLKYKPELKWLIESKVGALDMPNKLRNDLAVQVIFARLLYLRTKDTIPTDLTGQAKMYKKHFNTPKGKATVSEALEKYNKYVIN